MKPQDVAKKVKAGRGWLIVRNSGTLADTDYERVADEIVDALNKRPAYPKLVEALRNTLRSDKFKAVAEMEARALLRDLGEMTTI